MMTKSQRVEMETSHGFEKMRLTVVTELWRITSNANSEMQSLSECFPGRREERRGDTEEKQSRCIQKAYNQNCINHHLFLVTFTFTKKTLSRFLGGNQPGICRQVWHYSSTTRVMSEFTFGSL